MKADTAINESQFFLDIAHDVTKEEQPTGEAWMLVMERPSQEQLSITDFTRFRLSCGVHKISML
jgi:hypothetical protein